MLERCASALARVGVELLGVEVRDLMVPGDMKRLFAGVVAAKKEGEASLERVRAETAALRSLANAGRMIEDNPGLLQLRMLQQVGGSSGNTVVLSMPDGQGGTGPASNGAPARRDSAPDTHPTDRPRAGRGLNGRVRGAGRMSGPIGMIVS